MNIMYYMRVYNVFFVIGQCVHRQRSLESKKKREKGGALPLCRHHRHRHQKFVCNVYNTRFTIYGTTGRSIIVKIVMEGKTRGRDSLSFFFFFTHELKLYSYTSMHMLFFSRTSEFVYQLKYWNIYVNICAQTLSIEIIETLLLSLVNYNFWFINYVT